MYLSRHYKRHSAAEKLIMIIDNFRIVLFSVTHKHTALYNIKNRPDITALVDWA